MSSVDVVWSFIKMISARAVILGLLIGAMYFFKRFLRTAGPGMDQGEAIRIVATRYLGPKSTVMVMDIFGQVVVVGVCGNQMTYLTAITDPAALERLRNMTMKAKATPGSSFSEHLLTCKAKLESMRFKGRVQK
jgi:flagellar protein FliO/FliZ